MSSMEDSGILLRLSVPLNFECLLKNLAIKKKNKNKKNVKMKYKAQRETSVKLLRSQMRSDDLSEQLFLITIH